MVAAMCTAAFAVRNPLCKTTAYTAQSPCSCGLQADRVFKIRETRSMVMQQICRQKHAAKGATRRGAAFVGGAPSVKTLISHPGIEHPCGLRGDGRLKNRATGKVVTQQNCAR